MPQIEYDQVVIVSAPRSGTNFFCECLSDLPENLGLFEIFNARGLFGGRQGSILDEFSRRIGSKVKDVSDDALVEFVRDDPVAALNAIGAASTADGFSSFSYKVFPNQIAPESLGKILTSERARVVLIVRRRLDMFISYHKARTEDVWKNQSTKDLLPDIEVREFLKWSAQLDEWYESASQILELAGRPVDVFSYETDINVPKRPLVERLAVLLGERGLNVSTPDTAPPVRFQKQDRNVGPFKKIGNEDALRAALRERGKYNYALGTPLVDG